jgi:fructose-bisphosphate aldolase class II
VAPLTVIGPVMVEAAKKAKVPVCVHLDHCETLSYMKQALEIGFTGVMYDGSLLPYEENLANTRKAVVMAKKYNCGVEAELGALASREGGASAGSGPVYTDPDQAVVFCRETGIDALAPSFGTAHGIYKSKPVLDLERVKVISEKTGLPLVMHGGSGVSPEDYRTGIKNGLRKINYYSYMSKAGTQAVKELLAKEDVTFFHDLALAAEKAMSADAEKAMRVFAGL